jgi:hypothetical protein
MTTDNQQPPTARRAQDPRALLESLFATKAAPVEVPVAPASSRSTARMVLGKAPARDSDPRAFERNKRLARLLAAEGRHAISRVTELYLAAGFSLPLDQEIQLQLLEHSNEERVRDALSTLMVLFEREPPRRKTVLDARLRRLEENAEERATRELATALRRRMATAPLRA